MEKEILRLHQTARAIMRIANHKQQLLNRLAMYRVKLFAAKKWEEK